MEKRTETSTSETEIGTKPPSIDFEENPFIENPERPRLVGIIKPKRVLKKAERSNNDLVGLRSQLWAKKSGDVSYYDKAIFAALKTGAGIACDSITKGLNRIEIENHEAFLELLSKKGRNGRGLLTVANHLHYLDDPLLHAAMLDSRYLNSYKILFGNNAEYDDWKWTPADKKNFFYSEIPIARRMFRWFFGRTKTVPILRGRGLNQIAHQKLEEHLREGDWVNNFAEGGRTRKYGELRPFKPGVGKLISEAPETIILPFGHDGMEQVSPFGCAKEVCKQMPKEIRNKIVQFRKRIQIVFGEPCTLSDLGLEPANTREGYQEIADAIRPMVAECHQRAIELNRMAGQASIIEA